jgi:hypothetical protein
VEYEIFKSLDFEARPACQVTFVFCRKDNASAPRSLRRNAENSSSIERIRVAPPPNWSGLTPKKACQVVWISPISAVGVQQLIQDARGRGTNIRRRPNFM